MRPHLLIFMALLFLPRTVAQPEDDKGFSKEVIERSKRACVLIEVEDKNGKGHGSGVRFNEQGWIATNYHVVAGAERIKVIDSSGHSEEVTELMYYSPQRDIALLKTSSTGEYAKFKRSMAASEPIMAIGHPLEERWKVTKGRIVKVFSRKNREEIQIDADIAPGSSGGPILAKDGTICGLSTYLVRLTFRDGKYQLAQIKMFFGVSKASIVDIPVEKIKPTRLSDLRVFGEGWVIYDEQLPVLISEIDDLLTIFYKRIASQVIKRTAAGTGRTEIGGNSAFLKFRYELADPQELKDLISRYRALAVFINQYIPQSPSDPALKQSCLLLKAALRNALESAENLALIHGMANDQGEGYFLRSDRSRSLAVAAVRDAVHSYSRARSSYGDHSNFLTEEGMDATWARYIPSVSPPWAAAAVKSE
ncbi:serine protease [Rariglobus hedericola]